jgi:MFS family permease
MSQQATDRSSMFLSLRHRNLRIYFFGLLLSNVGTWLQFTAMSLLIYSINNKATDAGINTFAQFVPMLVLGAWAGGFADRHNRRRVTFWCQSLLGVQAVVLTVVTFTGHVSLPVIYLLSFGTGIASAIDNPSRRGLVTELVEPSEIPNAMSLNTTVMTGSRIFGPALAAVLVGPLGMAWLFALNAASYLFVIGSLLMIDKTKMLPATVAARGGKPVREGLSFVWRDPMLRRAFIVFTVVSTFAFNYSVVMPKLSDVRWGQANGYPILLTCVSIGSVFGALATARFTRITMRWYATLVIINGVSCIAIAWAPNFLVAWSFFFPPGPGGTGLVASMNGLSQQNTAPEMRSRMLALVAVAFLGSTPIGGPITGWIGDNIGIEWSIAYGGILTLLFVPMLWKDR